MNEELKNELEKEIEEIWKEELKEIENKEKETYSLIDTKFEKFSNEISKKINDFKIQKLNPKSNYYNLNLEFIDNTNFLINPIIISLFNIDSFVYLCLKNEISINNLDLNKKNNSNLFSLFSDLLLKIFFNQNINRDPIEIHNKLNKIMDKKLLITKDPGKIISFILNQLNCELNLNKKDNKKIEEKINNKNVFEEMIKSNKTVISDIFFITLKVKKECLICKKKNEFYKQEPLLNLEILDESKKKYNIEELIIQNYTKSNILCGDCRNMIEIKNTLEDLNNNILIINLKRPSNASSEIEINYQFSLKLQKEYQLISVIINKTNKVKIKVYCQNFDNHKWYLYDGNNQIIVENENEIINSKNALVLIYKKINI